MINKLMCFIFSHKQSCATPIRVWTTSKNKYVRKEYRCTCTRCGLKSKWIRWKHYPDAPKNWKEMYEQ